MREPVEYAVFQGDLKTIVTATNTAIKLGLGWAPCGGLAYRAHSEWAQAMVRYEEPSQGIPVDKDLNPL